MRLLPTREIENNVFKTVITVAEMGSAIMTAEEETEVLKNFPQILKYKDITFTATFKVENGVPTISTDSGSVSVSLDLNNIETLLSPEMKFVFTSDANKILASEIDDAVLTTSQLVSQAKCILFENKVIEKITELLTKAKGNINTFEDTTEVTI